MILDPKTGAVLAKASSPTYTVDELDTVMASGSDGELLDRATQALYAPGSTFKALTLSAALMSCFVLFLPTTLIKSVVSVLLHDLLKKRLPFA